MVEVGSLHICDTDHDLSSNIATWPPLHSMHRPQILRSKMYYGRARAMLALPLVLPMSLDRLPSVVSTVFSMVQDNLKTRKSSAAKMAQSALASIIKKDILCDPAYFSRVWCLAGKWSVTLINHSLSGLNP